MPRKRGSERQTVEVNSQTSTAAPVSQVAEICRWMQGMSPGVSVDVLLCRPFDALEMALNVGASVGKIPAAVAHQICHGLREWAHAHGQVVQAVNEICRCAMNERKRGRLKPAARARKRPRRLASALQ